MENDGRSRKGHHIFRHRDAPNGLRVYEETGSLEEGKSADYSDPCADPLGDLRNFKKVCTSSRPAAKIG
jgi:hypothetical protein